MSGLSLVNVPPLRVSVDPLPILSPLVFVSCPLVRLRLLAIVTVELTSTTPADALLIVSVPRVFPPDAKFNEFPKFPVPPTIKEDELLHDNDPELTTSVPLSVRV